MNKIPTVEELKNFMLEHINCNHANHEDDYLYTKETAQLCTDLAIEFAKLHVEAALKAVKTNINVDIDEFGNVTGYDDKMHKSILDSYPPSNIK